MAQRKQKNKVNTTKPNNVTSTTTTNTIFPFNVELLRNITPPLDVLIYPTIADMNAALGRIGTFYEHIKLSNKYLNRKEFKSEWKQIRRFQGFNFPMKVIFEWLEQANYTDLTEQVNCYLFFSKTFIVVFILFTCIGVSICGVWFMDFFWLLIIFQTFLRKYARCQS